MQAEIADPTPGADPPLGSACWDTANKRAVRILLEGILVTRCKWDTVYLILPIWSLKRVVVNGGGVVCDRF